MKNKIPIARTILIGTLLFYPVFELSRIIVSYVTGGHWVVEPLSLTNFLTGRWEGCYIIELAWIWFGYLFTLYVTFHWNKFIERKEIATVI